MPTRRALKPASNVFSLSDQTLADRLEFVEEIGFGNWGSVWACRPKLHPSLCTPNDANKAQDELLMVAVKLVHRCKTKTSAARVRSLWNEMKIVKSLEDDPHPSIMPFHSFIITPSYALITMTLFPTLIPVEVDEAKAKGWFKSLLSAVLHLHNHGVVHNDIKPTNILLSDTAVPIIIDFGFAEEYDVDAHRAFRSNLSYGTPEYLAPERASGLLHDTRKSDVWGLGITFFEILIGRTPFEYGHGQAVTTMKDLEKYLSRTRRGKWVGTWKMSKPIEKLLKRMLAPNVDWRYTAAEALTDPYWRVADSSGHQRIPSSSSSSSSKFEASLSKLKDCIPPWAACSEEDKENVPMFRTTPASATSSKERRASIPRLQNTLAIKKDRKAVASIITNLSAIKASPPCTPCDIMTKAEEKAVPSNQLGRSHGNGIRCTYNPAGLQSMLGQEISPPVRDQHNQQSAFERLVECSRTVENLQKGRPCKALTKGNDKVRQRVADWERERERLKDMERLNQWELARNDEGTWARAQIDQTNVMSERVDQELALLGSASSPSSGADSNPSSRPREFGVLSRNVKASIDKTVHAVAQVAGRITQSPPLVMRRVAGLTSHSRSLSEGRVTGSRPFARSLSVGSSAGFMSHARSRSGGIMLDVTTRHLDSWGGYTVMHGANSSLPVIRHTLHNEKVTPDAKLDRMTIWIRNVEKVVEEARQGFATASKEDTPLPALPPAPVPRPSSLRRARRPSSLPLPPPTSFQSFAQESDLDIMKSLASACGGARDTSTALHEPSWSGTPEETTDNARAPSVSERSLRSCPSIKTSSQEDNHPTLKCVDKPKSERHLLDRPIVSVAQLELELAKEIASPPVHRLSARIDPRVSPVDVPIATVSRSSSLGLDKFTFPIDVHREHTNDELDSSASSERRIDSVYDGLMISTSGQFDSTTPVARVAGSCRSTHSRVPKLFLSARRARPLPFSRYAQRKTFSVDELNVTTCSAIPDTSQHKDVGSGTTTLVRRVLNTIIGGATSPRQSKLHRLFPSSFW